MCGIETLEEFKLLAEDNENSGFLLKDTTSLQAIVLLLSNKDQTLVLSALQILITISEKPHSQSVLRSLLGFQEQLIEILSCKNIKDENIQLASRLLNFLDQSNFKAPQTKDCNLANTKLNLRPKCVILQLKGVESKENMEEVCSRLLKVQGVVSITFQLHKCRAIVCIVPNLDPECLVRAVCHSKSSNYHEKYDQTSQSEITAKIVKRTGRIHSLHRKSTFSRVAQVPSYLDENADLFEVDETRAAPTLRSQKRTPESNKSQGPINWLSDFFERSLFW